MHWVPKGDSHIRNIYDILLSRLDATKLMYHMATFDEESKNNVSNIDLYNNIASEAMPDSVATWDSIVPLSDLYIKEYQRKPRNTPETMQ
ncbi:hypothetical protein SK128_007203 [Halocaridina rubra]|uniref:Uncharacterized protein n=1 Tax=Halocaridina rubra TaxID=373956 RepID=A0AAN8XB45_HALRR